MVSTGAEKLVDDMNPYWIPREAPEPCCAETKNFTDNLEGLLIPTLKHGSIQDIEKTRDFMWTIGFILLYDFRNTNLNDLNE